MQSKSKSVKMHTSHTECCDGGATHCLPTPYFVADNVDVNTVTHIMRALTDPTRLKIVMLLAKQIEGVCVCIIADQFQLDQSTISHHLRSLRKVGIINGVRKGVCIYYHFCADALIPLTTFFETLENA